MGCHVQPVGQQGHGSADQTGHDLDDHRGRGHRDDNLGAGLPSSLLVLVEVVLVGHQ
jgi:hypothetical protein